MKSFRIGIILILVLIVGFIGWYSVSKNAPATKSQPLKVGLNPWIGNGAYYVAQEKKFFEKENINVEFVDIADIATERQLLRSGKIDVAYSLTPESVVVLNDRGVRVKIVAASDLSSGADGIIATQDIRRIEDLEGRKVAFEVGSTSHFLLSYLLNKKGLTTKDLEVVDEIAPDAGAAFVAGKVDAAVTWEPWLSKASERGGGHLLASSKDNPVIFDMPIFRAEVVEKRRGEVKALLRATFSAREWINKHLAEAVKVIAKNFKISEADAAEQIKGVYWLSYEDNLKQLATGEFSVRNSIKKASDFWFKLELIKAKVNTDQILDPSILKDLYK